MSKRDRPHKQFGGNSEIGRHLRKHGMCAGWTEYRYGSAKPIKLAPIFRGEKRKHVVSEVMDVLRDWRQSPFEFEGAARNALRSGLCLKGYDWARSDKQAAEAVEDALHQLGAVRPSYAKGQKEYALPRDMCIRCMGPLDLEDITAARRFCSRECSEAMRVEDAQRYESAMTRMWKDAAARRRREKVDPRCCARAECGKSFKSLRVDALYCSWECYRVASRQLPDIQCGQCSKQFRPRVQGMRFCSQRCARTSERTLPDRTCQRCGATFRRAPKFPGDPVKFCGSACYYETQRISETRECVWCLKPFTATNPQTQYCSASCKTSRAKFIRGAWVPTRLLLPVFDHMFMLRAA